MKKLETTTEMLARVGKWRNTERAALAILAGCWMRSNENGKAIIERAQDYIELNMIAASPSAQKSLEALRNAGVAITRETCGQLMPSGNGCIRSTGHAGAHSTLDRHAKSPF